MQLNTFFFFFTSSQSGLILFKTYFFPHYFISRLPDQQPSAPFVCLPSDYRNFVFVCETWLNNSEEPEIVKSNKRVFGNFSIKKKRKKESQKKDKTTLKYSKRKIGIDLKCSLVVLVIVR